MRGNGKIKRLQRRQLHKILDLVLNINGVQPSNRYGHPTAFFSFSGHTGGVWVQIFRTGWTPGIGNPDVSVYRYLECGSLSELEEILKEECPAGGNRTRAQK